MVKQVEASVHEIHDFVNRFTQIEVSSSEFSIFLECLRASVAKSYEFLLLSHSDINAEVYFFITGTLRGITEDLIVLKFILTRLDHEKREYLLQYIKTLESYERIKTQNSFFREYRPFQPVLPYPALSIENYETNTEQLKNAITRIWRENGWPKFKAKGRTVIPPVKEMATKISPGALDLLYEFIYRFTSSMVHFTPQTLLKQGWGSIQNNGEGFSGRYSVKHMPFFYKKFCQIYGGLLFCVYFEFFAEKMELSEIDQNIIFDIRQAILFDNRWPEMITFEEMNQEVPQIYRAHPELYATMHAEVIMKFSQGFIVS